MTFVVCHEFAAKKNLKFGTNPDPVKSKTKCIVFSKAKKDKLDLQPVHLNGDPLPWVGQVKHLGNLLQSDNSMSVDISQKRGKFVGKVNSLLQEFHYAQPEVITKLVNVYATSFYGSGTWNIFSGDCEKLYKSWNVTIRQIFGLSWHTHRYLIEHISDCLHPKVMLASRYVTFYKSLVGSTKFTVRFLSRMNEMDKRTVLGKTLSSILEMCSLPESRFSDLNAKMVKDRCSYFKVPGTEQWRLPLLTELLAVKNQNLLLGEFETEEIEEMIDYLCVS